MSISPISFQGVYKVTLPNVKEAKKIYVMNKGDLVEEGTHNELMKLKGYYNNMVNKQNELEEIREVC